MNDYQYRVGAKIGIEKNNYIVIKKVCLKFMMG